MEIPHVYTGNRLSFAEGSDQLKSLVHKAKSGDQAAFSDIYSLYFKKIYRFIYFRVGHKEVAEDLAGIYPLLQASFGPGNQRRRHNLPRGSRSARTQNSLRCRDQDRHEDI